MMPEQLDVILEQACGSPEYNHLCLAISFYERGEADDNLRLQQIGECLIEIIQAQHQSFDAAHK